MGETRSVEGEATASPVVDLEPKGSLACITRKCARRSTIIWSWDAVESDQWKKAEARRMNCGKASSPIWMAGANLVSKSYFARPAACHSRAHKNCRKDDVVERVMSLKGKMLLGLNFKRTDNSKKRRDYLWLTFSEKWRDFKERWRKSLGKVPRHVAVLEAHTSGYPHLHGVFEGGVDVSKEQLKKLWMMSEGGYQLFWERLKTRGAYIAKYVNKQDGLPEDVAALILCNRIRMVYSTPGLGEKTEKESDWIFERGSRVRCECFIRAASGQEMEEMTDDDNN